MKCLIYVRVSTVEQAEQDLSIPAQLQAAREYAKQREWQIIEEFVEPGASAKTTDRPALQRMLSRVKDDESGVGVVLVHKVDRLARNVYDHAMIRALFKKHGVRLASVVENVDESVSGELVENIMASIAQFYSANLAQETLKGMRQLALRGGWPHRPPRGYVMVRNSSDTKPGSRCEVHPREGPVISHAFEQFGSGMFSVEAVSHRLAKEGLLSATGRPLSHSQMHRVLTNPFYMGRILWKDVDVRGQHQPLVTGALFERVQRVVLARRTDPVSSRGKIAGLPLRAFATCATCRGRLTGERHGRFTYYRCSRQAYRRELCDARYARADRVHQDITRVLRQVQITHARADTIIAEVERLLAARMEMAKHRRSQIADELARVTANEVRLTEVFMAGGLSSDAFKGKTAALRDERRSLESERDSLSVEPEVLRAKASQQLDLITSIGDIYEQLNVARKADFLRGVFAAIVVSPEGVVGFTLRAPFDEFQPSEGKLRSLPEAEALLRLA